MGPLLKFFDLIIVDFFQLKIALPWVRLGELVARCIPGILGGALSLCVSCRQRISGLREAISSAFEGVRPSALKLIFFILGFVL